MHPKTDILELLCYIKQLLYTNGDEVLLTGYNQSMPIVNYYWLQQEWYQLLDNYHD